MRFSVCDCVSAMRSLVSGARCPVASDVWSPPGGVEEHLSAQFLSLGSSAVQEARRQ